MEKVLIMIPSEARDDISQIMIEKSIAEQKLQSYISGLGVGMKINLNTHSFNLRDNCWEEKDMEPIKESKENGTTK